MANLTETTKLNSNADPAGLLDLLCYVFLYSEVSMDIYPLIIFIWVVGWLYSCGVHTSNKNVVLKYGNDDDKSNLGFGGALQYVVLFFFWPHYLGYGKND